MWFGFLLASVVVLLYTLCSIRKPHGYPPGPKWLPIVGNLFEFLKLRKELNYTHLVWQHWVKKYGPLLGIKLGLDKIVIVSNYKYANSILHSDEYEGRPDGFLFRMRSLGKRLGVIFTDGQFGLEQRKFCLKHLRTYGFGRSSMEERINEEISEFIAFVKDKCKEGPVDIYNIINVHVLNSLWSMIAGKRFSPMDKRLLKMMEYIHTSFRLQDMSGGLLNQMPSYRFFGPGKKMYNSVKDVVNALFDFIQETVDEHKSSLNEDSIRDVIDAYLLEINERQSEDSPSFNEDQLLVLLLDLFMAGADSTTNTLSFTAQYLMMYPNIQKTAQDEIDKISKGSQISLKDRKRFHYLEALIMESQRFSNIAPVTIPHRAKKTVELDGYIIPKDTTVLVNLYNIHMDKDHWKDPENFRPERFLDLDGNLIQDEWWIPFGLGRRRCLGETLARASVFKYLAAILQNFTITFPPGVQHELMPPVDGAILFPSKFTAQLIPR